MVRWKNNEECKHVRYAEEYNASKEKQKEKGKHMGSLEAQF